jgi:hypothetical protein
MQAVTLGHKMLYPVVFSRTPHYTPQCKLRSAPMLCARRALRSM